MRLSVPTAGELHSCAIDHFTPSQKHVLDGVSRQGKRAPYVCGVYAATRISSESDVLARWAAGKAAGLDDFACMRVRSPKSRTSWLSSLNDNVIIHTGVREERQLLHTFLKHGAYFAC